MTNSEAIEYGKEQLEIFGGQHAEFIRMAIEALSAQPEIIRCKDCKHYADRWFTYHICMIDARAVNTDDFCSYGERGKKMGTNYYVVRNRPTTTEPIHIGKSSIGWRFHFQTQNEKYNDPPIIWYTYEQVCEWLYKNTVEDDKYVIMDEYDEIVSFEEFIHLVEEKQQINNPDNFVYARNVNGFRFSDEWFC